MALQFSRGCPFNCEFCDIVRMFGHIPGTRTPTQCMGEVEVLYSAGYHGRLFILDDRFIANKKQIKEMLKLPAAWQEGARIPLRAANKNQNVACNMNAAIEKVQKEGIEVMGGFIQGFDTDPDDVAIVSRN